MKRLLLTGASGFIGRHCLTSLAAHGYEVHAVSSRVQEEAHSHAIWHRVNLLHWQNISDLISTVKPTHLLHLAWHVAPGEWKTGGARENFLWLQTSLELVRQFYECGGKRVVMAGTCNEYDWNHGYCSEYSTPRDPNTFYGKCKKELQALVDAYSSEMGLSSAWGRIFFVYGPFEDPARLVSLVINALLRGQEAQCSAGTQMRDYLYVQDVADALIALLESNVGGAVNIGSGCAVAVRDIVHTIGAKLDREHLIRLGALNSTDGEWPVIVADVTRLSKEVGWHPRYDLSHGLEHTIHWWKSQLTGRRIGRHHRRIPF